MRIRRVGTLSHNASAAAELDASLLLLPIVGFLPPDDPRIRGTVSAIERELVVDGLVMRYRTSTDVDGLPPGEGVFLPCSFWLADNYTLQNRDAEARALFERLLSLRNDVGLLAEEYDPHARRQVRKFSASVLARRPDQNGLEPARGPVRRNDASQRPRPSRLLRRKTDLWRNFDSLSPW